MTGLRDYENLGGDDQDLPAEAWREEPGDDLPRKRSLAVWVLVGIDFALALAAGLFLFYLRGAERYLLEGSSEFGSELLATRAGIGVMRIAACVLVAGFAVAALGIISRTRFGWWIQLLWALALSLTIAGAIYGIPALAFSMRRGVRPLPAAGQEAAAELLSGRRRW